MRVLILALIAFSAEFAAAATVPCGATGLPPSVSALAAGLNKAPNDAARLEIAAQAASLTVDKSLSASARACAAYLAGSAHFINSTGPHRRRAAARALGFFLRAAALAPDAMAGLQARSRQKTAWKRLGKVPGWVSRPAPQRIKVPAAEEDDVLILSPGSPQSWAKVCGDSPSCRDAGRFELPRRAGQALELQLAPGAYGVARRTAFGTSAHPAPLEIEAGDLAAPPPAPCAVQLRIEDGEGVVSGWRLTTEGETSIDPANLKADMGPVTVSARGYVTQQIPLPAAGGPLRVRLARCSVAMKVRTVPSDARLEGVDPGPWGRRVIRARRPGHQTLEHAVEVPAPDQCAGASHPVSLVMERNVLIAAAAGNGEAVTPSRFLVDGRAVDVLGFHRPPGQYTFRVDHPIEGTVTGRFEVSACTGGACPPVALRISFAPRRRPPSKASKWAMGIGAGLLLGGLAAGLSAYDAHQQLENYTNKFEMGESVDDIKVRRDEQAQSADSLFLVGGTLIGAGYFWYQTSQEPQ